MRIQVAEVNARLEAEKRRYQVLTEDLQDTKGQLRRTLQQLRRAEEAEESLKTSAIHYMQGVTRILPLVEQLQDEGRTLINSGTIKEIEKL